MSKVRFEDFKIRGTRVGASSRFPALRELIKTEISAKLDEYGFVNRHVNVSECGHKAFSLGPHGRIKSHKLHNSGNNVNMRDRIFIAFSLGCGRTVNYKRNSGYFVIGCRPFSEKAMFNASSL